MGHTNSENYGLVFAGGGAKGAWQIGVLKALLKEGYLDRTASIAAGTSVGALNAVLYSLDPKNFDHAEKIWTEAIQEYPIIKPKLPDIIRNLFVLPAGLSICFIVDLVKRSKKVGTWSNKNLKTVIDEGIRGRELQVPVSVCAYNMSKKEAHDQPINPKDKDISNWLLASTAIPYIFPSIEIDGTIYTDGGFGWDTPIRWTSKSLTQMRNAPIAPIIRYNEGKLTEDKIKKVYLLALSQDEETYWEQKFEQLDILPIMPSEDLGNPLDFSEKHIKELLKLGEDDGEKWVSNSGKSIISCDSIRIIDKIIEKIDTYEDEFDKIKDDLSDLLESCQSELDQSLADYEKHKSEENLSKIRENILLQYTDKDIDKLKKNNIGIVFDAYEEILRSLVQENKSEDEYIFFNNNCARLIALVESTEKHKEASKQNLLKWALSYCKHKKMISELQDEERAKIKSFLEMIKGILGFIEKDKLRDAKRAMKSMKTLDKDIGKLVEKIRKAIENARARCKNLPIAAPPLDMPDKPTEYFVGRDKELRQIEESEADVLLWGYPGNGMKQIALKYAESHGNQFPGGKYYIDATGKHSFDEILASLLEDSRFCKYWSINEKPQKISDCAALVCDQLKKAQLRGKTLLIIVNVNEPEPENGIYSQKRILDQDNLNKLVGENQHLLKVIVTSNSRQFTKVAIEKRKRPLKQIHIEKLEEQDGLELLAEYCPSADERIRQEIYKSVGGNAFALTMVGKHFSGKLEERLQDVSPENYFKEMQDKKTEKRLMKVYWEKCWKPEYENCTSIQRNILKYAALFPADNICSKWICNLLEKESPDGCDADYYLRTLTEDRGLLDYKNSGDSSFCVMIPKIQEMILNLDSPEDVRKHAEKLCRHIVENEFTSHSLSQEETVLLGNAFCIWSKEEWKECILPILFSLSLYDDLGDYLTEYQLYPLREKVCQAAEDILKSMPESEEQQKNWASCLIYRGHIKFDLEHYGTALKCYQESYEIRQKIFGKSKEVTFLPLEYQGTVYGRMKNNNMPQAEIIFRECEKKFIQYENAGQNDHRTAMETLARLYKRWADASYENNKKEDAEKYYKMAVDRAEQGVSAENDTPGGVGSILLGCFERNLGVFYKKEGRNEEAIRWLEKSNKTLGKLSKTGWDHPDIERNNDDLKFLASLISGKPV